MISLEKKSYVYLTNLQETGKVSLNNKLKSLFVTYIYQHII